MHRGSNLLNLISQWTDIILHAHEAKQDPERRPKVVRFGVCAIIYALFTIVCALGLLLFQFAGDGLFVTIICVLFGVAIGVIATLVCLITALIYWFCQLSVNKKPMTWISLVIMLACFAAAVIIPLMFLTA